jgi:hypothetical protein
MACGPLESKIDHVVELCGFGRISAPAGFVSTVSALPLKFWDDLLTGKTYPREKTGF